MESNKYPIGGYAPGNYHNRCTTCERSFFGDKRAFECEPCGIKSQAEWDAMTHEQQEERLRRNAEKWKELMSKHSSNEQLSGADQVCGKTELNNLAAISNAPAGPRWVKAVDRLPGWKQSVKWKSHEGAEVGKHPLFAMTDPGTAEAMDGWEWLDESPTPAAGREEGTDVFIPCTEDDPDRCGGFTSDDGRSLCYVKVRHIPASALKQKEGK